MQFAPKPGVHPAHRRAHDESGVIHAKATGQQSILRFDHVDVPVARKLRVQPVARFARFAVTDSVRKNDEKFCGIERLVFSEKFTGKFRPDELGAAAGCPVHDQHCVGDFSLCIFVDLAEGPIMNLQFGQRFARGEFEITNCVIAFDRRRIIRRRKSGGGADERKQNDESNC